MITSEVLVSLADIARRAGVQRPAASNWRRRYADFPPPAVSAEPGLFHADQVANWLDRRRIPRSALAEGERPGDTFGDRFRRTFVDEARAQEPVSSTARGETAVALSKLADQLMRSLVNVRDITDPSGVGDLILAMVYLRATDPREWKRFVSEAKVFPADAALDRLTWLLEERLRPSPVNLPRDLGGRLMLEISTILDEADVLADAEGHRPGQVPAARLYEELLEGFALLEGHRGGEFYTPRSVVSTLVRMLEPQETETIFDPCCGTGGMLAAAATHAGSSRSGSVVGSTLSDRALFLATMNLAVHGVSAALGNDAMEDLRVGWRQRAGDVVLANPPFRMSRWSEGARSDDPRWRYGRPPATNANYAWLQHFAYLLSERGRAGVVMPVGTTFAADAQGKIRAAMAEDGLVDCVVALPSQLFISTAIPVCIWILRKSRSARRGVLFIDARRLGEMGHRSVRVLSDADISKIANVYHHWLTTADPESFEVIEGFARRAGLAEIRERNHSLSPPEYVLSEPERVGVGALRGRIRELEDDLDALRSRAVEVDGRIAGLLGRLR